MLFTRKLHEGIRSGAITCSVRIWMRPRVKVGGRYRLGRGHIRVTKLRLIGMEDITPELARRSGFKGVVDLLKIAKHGSGTNVYLVRFHRVAQGRSKAPARKAASGEKQRKRIATIVASFPEAEAKPTGRHMSLEVRGKRFGWFMIDHHGDGRVALNCKASAEMHDILQRLVPAHFHVPKYVGSKGWVGVWLDLPKLDWAAVELALREAYVRTAPKKLAAQVSPVLPAR